MNNKINWETKQVDINLLKPASYNPRKLDRKAKPSFSANIEKYGAVEPIVVNQDMTIIGGHMRYNLYLEQGERQVEVSYPDRLLTSDEEKKLNLTLNSVGGFTNTAKLLNLGLSVQELNILGFYELKMPDEKASDTRAEVKSKNPLVYNLYYFRDDFFRIKKTVDSIMKDKSMTQSEAMLFLIRM